MSKRNVKHRRIFLVLLSFLVILSSGIFWNDAEADVLQRGPKLKKSDPINEDNGFPLWYKDSAGTMLELCLDANDPSVWTCSRRFRSIKANLIP